MLSLLRKLRNRKKHKTKITWHKNALTKFVDNSVLKFKKRKGAAKETSYWWSFIFSWPQKQTAAILDFIAGAYKFEPLNTYTMPEETLIVWSYIDRLFVRAILYLIKPVFKHIISAQCLHLQGPSGVKTAVAMAHKALESENFRYFMRLDIKSYYASIDHKILTKQTQEYFKDLRVLNYLDQIINIPILKDGAITNPTTGIPRRSSISPFLGALYLSPLDKIFEKSEGIYYLRYMDDILVLAKTKKQFCRARRRLQNVLSMLKLRLSKRKSKIGVLTKGFHFLGVDFKVNDSELEIKAPASKVKAARTQIQQAKTQVVSVSLHERSVVRALDKVILMKVDAVHPAEVQKYILRWATWWSRTCELITGKYCLQRFVNRAQVKAPELCYLGDGLLKPLSRFCDSSCSSAK